LTLIFCYGCWVIISSLIIPSVIDSGDGLSEPSQSPTNDGTMLPVYFPHMGNNAENIIHSALTLILCLILFSQTGYNVHSFNALELPEIAVVILSSKAHTYL
jgi:hypothetical protein